MIIYTLNKEYANMEKEEVMTKKEQIKSALKVIFIQFLLLRVFYRVPVKYLKLKISHIHK